MAKEETNIVHRAMMRVSPKGTRLFKNVRGLFYAKTEVDLLKRAIINRDWNMATLLVKRLRMVSAGIQCPASSDLWGFHPMTITPEMVGRKIAVLVVFEAKTETGAVRKDQADFIRYMHESGAISGVIRSPDDAENLINNFVD